MSEATRVHERGEQELHELWERFKSTGDAAAREGLILHYSALVKFVAGRLRAGLPRNVDPQDLVSYGTFGLINAIDKLGINYPCALGTESIQQQIPNLEVFPTTIFIDKTGTVRSKIEGLHDYAELEERVQELLAE